VLCDTTRLKATIGENLPKGIRPEDATRRLTYFSAYDVRVSDGNTPAAEVWRH
jgi:hypothetical protein